MINPYSTPPMTIPGSPNPTPNPTPNPSSTPSPASLTTVCTVTGEIIFLSWSVWIPIPYRGAQDCNALYKALEKGINLSNWQCVEKDQDTQLWFNTPNGGNVHNYGKDIDPILESHFKGLTSTCGPYYSSG